MEKKECIKRLTDMLVPYGFRRKGNRFMRLYEGEIFQHIHFVYDPRSRYDEEYKGNGYYFWVSVGSIFYKVILDPIFFDDMIIRLRGLGIYFYPNYYEGYHPSAAAPERIYEMDFIKQDEEAQLDIIEKTCLPILNSIYTTTQLPHLYEWLLIHEFGEDGYSQVKYRYYGRMIVCLLCDRQYEKVPQYCEDRIRYINEEKIHYYADRLPNTNIYDGWKAKQWNEEIETYEQVLKWLREGNTDAIKAWLNTNRKDNLQMLANYWPKRALKELQII